MLVTLHPIELYNGSIIGFEETENRPGITITIYKQEKRGSAGHDAPKAIVEVTAQTYIEETQARIQAYQMACQYAAAYNSAAKQ